MDINTSLSSGQAKFALWVEDKMPYLLHLFDFDKRMLITANLEQYLSVASHGQQIMARFVATVWTQENKYDFDIVDAASVLDQSQLDVVTDWMNKPIWP